MTEKTLTSKKPFGGTIENWEIVSAMSLNDRYQCLGELHGDPNQRFPEGFSIYTSLLVEIGPDEIETLNTMYKLGKAKSDGK